MIDAVLRFAPAALANTAPVLAKGLLKDRFSVPIDFGLKLSKHRILGDGKTWRGFLSGVLVGWVTGAVFGNASLGLLLGTGAMLGDLTGSFLKRRLGFLRGDYAGFVDQLDFALGAFICTWSEWSLSEVVFILLLVPPAHKLTNILAHRAGFKSVPW